MSQPPVTALALSAGGLFGAYQAGVWQGLAGIFKPDIVVGASVGALNGWLIAAGADPSDLVDRWTRLDSIQRLKWRIPKHPADGCLDAAILDGWIQEMVQASQPRAHYGVVLTELPRMRPRLFRWPDIDWRHIAASCAVPGFLRQHRFDGRYYTDGGFLDPSPVWAAVAMGAQVVVSVNVMRYRPLPVRAAVRMARAYTRYCPPPPGNTVIVDIDPVQRLGSARDSMYWSLENSTRWIQEGLRNAETCKHFLVECLQQEVHHGHLPYLPAEGIAPAAVPLGSAHQRRDIYQA